MWWDLEAADPNAGAACRGFVQVLRCALLTHLCRDLPKNLAFQTALLQFVYLIFFLNVIFCGRRNLSSLRRDASEKDFESSKDLCLLPRTQEHILLGYLICAGSSNGDLSKGCFRRPEPSLCLCLACVFSVPSRLFSSFWLLFGFFCSRGNHG